MEPIKLPDISVGTISGSLVFPGIKYQSGGRQWITVTIPYKVLGKLVTTSVVKKKNQTVIKSEIKNRFLDAAHKNDIKNYLVDEPKFILPPITLVSLDKLPFRPYVFDDADKSMSEEELLQSRGSILGLLYLPMDHEFECLDGNHRTAAIRELAESNPEAIAGSNMLVNIVYEEDVWKVRQDFVDVNKNAKQTTSSINTLFNTRDALSSIVAETLDKFDYLTETTELLATSVSKLSKDIYTINIIKNAIIELAGYSSQSTVSEKKVSQRLKEEKEFLVKLKEDIAMFFDILKENDFINECLVHREKTPEIRANTVITSSVGLVIASRIAKTVIDNFANEEDMNSEEVRYQIRRLIVSFDWSRNNTIFEEGGIIVGDNKITNNREAIQVTVGLIKRELGYLEEEPELAEEEEMFN